MTRWIALLRGVNVGGHRKVPMARLRAILEACGCREVSTLLASGNAVFSSPQTSEARLRAAVEKALAGALGFEVEVVLRTREELAAALKANPLRGAEKDPARFLVVFLSAPPNPERLAALKRADWAPDEFRAVGREIYARFPGGLGRSKLAPVLTSDRLGAAATGRNWATVGKLLELADG